ncbi:MAG: coproporphyrinogen-III oxidase family protein [Candidatus Omnitrophota bacterium]
MDQNTLRLPENYFDGKDGESYRFTILKDIAIAGSEPLAYDESKRHSILELYPKYKDFALYVHFPWCAEHCSYCHYYRGPIKRSEYEKLLAAERSHLQMLDDHIGLHNKNVRSIYFGGGTPTVIPNDLLEESLAYYGKYRSDDCEMCVESSIVTLTDKRIEVLEKYVNRLSIGVQSLNDLILQIIERKHKAAQAEEVLQEVIPRFHSVNVDLIYGLYTQNLDDWLTTIRKTIKLKAQSLTLYRLDIRETPSIMTLFRQEPEKFPDEPMCRRMYEEAKKMLEDAGYRENLVGWFLLPQVKDTIVYRERWQKQSPCIALGPGLHNYAADHFYETLTDRDQYMAAVESGALPIQHVYDMTPKKQLVWYVLAQWKSNDPVYQSVITQRFGPELLNWFKGLIRNYLNWKVLEESEDKITVKEESHYFIEWVILELIAALK